MVIAELEEGKHEDEYGAGFYDNDVRIPVPYSVFPVEVSLGSSTHSTAIMVIRKATGTFYRGFT